VHKAREGEMSRKVLCVADCGDSQRRAKEKGEEMDKVIK